MSNPDLFSPSHDVAAIFAALGDRTRLSLLHKLSNGGSQSLVQLSSGADLSRQAVTKHLRVLGDAGLVSCQRVGRESQYVFHPEPLVFARNYIEGVSQLWDEALTRLQAFIEEK